MTDTMNDMPETIYAVLEGESNWCGWRCPESSGATSYTLTSAIEERERAAYNQAIDDCLDMLIEANDGSMKSVPQHVYIETVRKLIK